MNLVDEIHKLAGMVEKGAPRLAKSGLFKNKLLGLLKEARRAELMLLWQDTEADHGPWEEEECEEPGIQSGQGMNATRIERLERQLHDTSNCSTERTRTASVIVLKP